MRCAVLWADVIPTQEVLLGIKLGFTLLPMIFLAISIIPIYFLPYHGEYYEDLREKVKLNYENKLEKKNKGANLEVNTNE